MGNGKVSGLVSIMGALVRDGVIRRIRKVHVGLTVRSPQTEMRFSEAFNSSVQSRPKREEPLGCYFLVGSERPFRDFVHNWLRYGFRMGCGPCRPCHRDVEINRGFRRQSTLENRRERIFQNLEPRADFLNVDSMPDDIRNLGESGAHVDETVEIFRHPRRAGLFENVPIVVLEFFQLFQKLRSVLLFGFECPISISNPLFPISCPKIELSVDFRRFGLECPEKQSDLNFGRLPYRFDGYASSKHAVLHHLSGFRTRKSDLVELFQHGAEFLVSILVDSAAHFVMYAENRFRLGRGKLPPQ